VQKLHNPGVTVINDHDQTGASGQQGLFFISPPPILVNFGIPPSVTSKSIKRKQFSELLNSKWPNGYHEILQSSYSLLEYKYKDDDLEGG